ncbi:MAG: hypothetical protein LBI44_08440 [Oscillospiraceae bacterium]|jgi:hypothetical protein|nr:hypothetical protein [Oscillospiraceae bacterium]
MQTLNELFAACYLARSCLRVCDGKVLTTTSIALHAFLRELLNFLKYRHFTQQTLEMVLEAFVFGTSCSEDKSAGA